MPTDDFHNIQKEVEEVFLRHARDFRRHARHILGTRSRDSVEDIIQEAMMRVIEARRKRTEPIPNIFAYSMVVISNLVTDRARREQRERMRFVEETEEGLPQVPGEDPPVEDIVRFRLFVETLDQELSRLPARTQEAFRLYHTTNMTQAEIARQLQCSTPLVNKMINDAVEVLKKYRHLL